MKMPTGWQATPTAVTASPKKLHARIDMSADVAGQNLCPECKKPMRVFNVNGSTENGGEAYQIKAFGCPEHRIVLPAPDDASNAN